MSLDFVRIECEIITDISADIIPALHTEARNFENYFKALCCTSTQALCSSCPESNECCYPVIFARQLSPDPEIVRLHQKPSLPFSLYISEIDSATSPLTIGIVVIGTAVNCLELFHTALTILIKKCVPATQSSVPYPLRCFSIDYCGVRHEISIRRPLLESVIMLSGQHILWNTVHSSDVRLTLISPLRLVSNGLIAHRFDFAMFFRSQLRRCSSLWSYYGTGELDLDFAALSRAASSVAVLENEIRYIQPSWAKRLNGAGLIGSAECSGLVEPMLSLLVLGSFFNAGKGSAFGSGFHIIEVM